MVKQFKGACNRYENIKVSDNNLARSVDKEERSHE
jgi:hypothetical protein